LLGSGFTGATDVKFGGTSAAFTVVSDNAIVATAPAGAAGVVDVRVTTYGGTSAATAADHYTYAAAPLPQVTSPSASSGGPGGGDVVTISGSSSTRVPGVTWGGVPAASFVVRSDGEVRAVAPPHAAGDVDVRVSTAAGVSATSAADRFTYLAAGAPAVTGVS